VTDIDEFMDELSDNEMECLSTVMLDTLAARVEVELESIFPDAGIVSVEWGKPEDGSAFFRMTLRGIDRCPEISPDRIRKVADVLGPDINIDVDYSTPVSNGFVLATSPRIESDADEEC